MTQSKDQQENIKAPEKSFSDKEQAVPLEHKEESPLEKREMRKEDEIVSAELRREIEMMALDDNLKKQAEQKVQKISFLADDDKLKNLLKIAKDKGVLFAIHVAKRMNDPFILDTLHDTLSREGYYKDFIK